MNPLVFSLYIVGAFGFCDMDNDGDIDTADTAKVSAIRNTPYWEGSPADCNGDKLHTSSDVTCCTPRCTRPNCAQ